MKKRLLPGLDIDKVKFRHDYRAKTDLKEPSFLRVDPIPKLVTYPFKPWSNKLDYPQKLDKTKIPKSKKKQFRSYRFKVMALTEKVAHKVKGIEKRGFRAHHIDHIISIYEGFLKGIPVEKIASLKNLRMLHHRDNMRKGRQSVLLL